MRAYAAVKEFYEDTAIPEEHWIKLIVGARLETKDGYSLLAYPMDLEGYKRLSRLLTVGNRRAAKEQCELYFEDIAQHAEGLIAIVLPPRNIDDPAFHEKLRKLARLFGKRCYLAGNFLFRGNDAERLANLDNLAAQMKVRLRRHQRRALSRPRATRAARRHHRHTPHLHRRRAGLPPLRLGRTPSQVRGGDGAALSQASARHRVHSGNRQALQLLAETAALSVPQGHEGGETPMQRLERLTWEGAAFRYPEGVSDKIAQNIRKEFALIQEKGIAPYFLTVHDIVKQARDMNILCQGRGSAANSTVCYCLRITEIDTDKERSSVRALPVQRAQRTARHRCRFRA